MTMTASQLRVRIVGSSGTAKSIVCEMIVDELKRHPDFIIEMQQMEREFLFGKNAMSVTLDDIPVARGFIDALWMHDKPVSCMPVETRQARVQRLRGSRW